MITISVCMIVKNEEKSLSECLDCLVDFADEIIIVDTGSTDKTKKIAKKYTDKIYDFEWIDDFAAARNFAFEKAGMEYIYTADADELVDEENKKKLMVLKKAMLSEVEIVQMKYTNQLKHGTTYNYDIEYRPKLFKRLRSFRWIDPIHETINTNPVVYDSEVEIIHNPHESHAKRDFDIFTKIILRGEKLSTKLKGLYARELFIAGSDEDFLNARDYFIDVIEDDNTTADEFREASCVVVRAARLSGDTEMFFESTLKMVADNPSSEICCELGEYYMAKENYDDAIIWFINAIHECSPILNIHCNGDYPMLKLSKCYEAVKNTDKATEYDEMAKEWANNKMR